MNNTETIALNPTLWDMLLQSAGLNTKTAASALSFANKLPIKGLGILGSLLTPSTLNPTDYEDEILTRTTMSASAKPFVLPKGATVDPQTGEVKDSLGNPWSPEDPDKDKKGIIKNTIKWVKDNPKKAAGIAIAASTYPGRKALEWAAGDVGVNAFNLIWKGEPFWGNKSVDTVVDSNKVSNNPFDSLTTLELEKINPDTLDAEQDALFTDAKLRRRKLEYQRDSVNVDKKQQINEIDYRTKILKEGGNPNKKPESTEVENKSSVPIDTNIQNASKRINETLQSWDAFKSTLGIPDSTLNKPDTTLNNKVNLNMFDYQQMFKYV